MTRWLHKAALLIIVLWAGSASAAVSIVQQVKFIDYTGATYSSKTVDLPGSWTAGNMLLVKVTWFPTAFENVGSVTSNGSNSLTGQTTTTDSSSTQYWLHKNLTGTPQTGIVVTFSSAVGFIVIEAWELSGQDTGTQPDVAAVGQSQLTPGTSTDLYTSGNMTTVTNGAFIFGTIVSINNANSDAQTSAGTGYTGQTAQLNAATLVQKSETRTQTTAGSIAATFTLAVSDHTITQAIAIRPSAAVTPTFSSAPTIGTRTTSSIPISFTSDTTGTAYGARLTDGSGAPTCDQLEAQTATGAIQYASEASVATVADTLTFGSITSGTVTDIYVCLEDGSGNDTAVASSGTLANAYKLPAFQTPLTIASQTETVYTTNSKVLDGAGTVDLVACLKDAAPPTVSQVEARTGGCIINGSTDDATGTMTLTPSGTVFPLYDLYYVGSYGSQHEAAVHALTDEFLDEPAGYQFTLLTSVSGTGWPAALNAVITPDIAAADVVKTQTTVSPGGFAWTQGADGDGEYTDGLARQALIVYVYDTSVGAWMTGGPTTLYFNNLAPSYAAADLVLAYKINTAITPIDLCALADDPEGDTLTGNDTAGTWPAGLNNGGTGGCTLSGTPTIENENGVAVTYTVTDIAGATGAVFITLYPLDTITVPNCTSTATSGASCQGLMELHWLVPSSTIGCSPTVAYGNVISQIPTAGAEAEPFSDVDIVVSRGLCVTAPAVKGLTQSAAETIIEGLGLLHDSHSIFAYCIPVDQVFGQRPSAGQAFTDANVVDLYVSAGPPDSRVVRCAKAPPAGVN